jgi:hypothetical protein
MTAKDAFDILTIALGLASAVLWFISAAVNVPTIRGTIDDLDNIQTLTDALQRQSKWSKWAAIATGLAVLVGVIAKVYA